MSKIEVVDNLKYIDITDEWLNKRRKVYTVKERKFYKYNGKIYRISKYNNHVVLDYSYKERKMAEWIAQHFGGKIYINPRINIPMGIATADYIWNNELWDLKTMSENAISKTRAVDNIIKTAKKQTTNIILDITKTKLSNDNIIKQVKKIYNTKGRNWIDKIIIIRNYKVIKIYKRK